MLIALADNADFLMDIKENFIKKAKQAEISQDDDYDYSLYSDGFCGRYFVEVVEQSKVWSNEIEGRTE